VAEKEKLYAGTSFLAALIAIVFVGLVNGPDQGSTCRYLHNYLVFAFAKLGYHFQIYGSTCITFYYLYLRDNCGYYPLFAK
jgi:hypothetical protein